MCAGLGLARRPADVMLTLLAALGLVAADDGVYRVTDAARQYLVASSPLDLGPYFASLKDRTVCQAILEVLRTGRPFAWADRQADRAWARHGARGVRPRLHRGHGQPRRAPGASPGRGAGRRAGQQAAWDITGREATLDIAGQQAALDIAGGSGIYACAVASRHPHLRAAVLEKPPVDQVARRWIAQRGMADRVDVVAGDMFRDPLPPGFDIHLYSNVVHDWDEPEVRTLLGRSFAALPAEGLVVIHDAHINEDKAGPLAVAEYSVLLMLTTEGKCYSVGEVRGMLHDAGFADVQWVPTAAYRSVVVARKPG